MTKEEWAFNCGFLAAAKKYAQDKFGSQDMRILQIEELQKFTSAKDRQESEKADNKHLSEQAEKFAPKPHIALDEQKCVNCLFAVLTSPNIPGYPYMKTECRRFPKIETVSSLYWCGEWKEREQ